MAETWTFEIDLQEGSGWQSLTNYGGEDLVLADSVEKTEILHNDKFEPVQDSVKFRCKLKTTLAQALLSNDPDKVILCRITHDGSWFFTGYVRPITKFTVTQAQDTIQFEVLDNSYLLQDTPSSPIQYSGYKVCDPSDKDNSIVHQLLAEAGYTLGTDEVITDTIDTEITHYRREEDEETFAELIREQLYNYGYVYYFDEQGRFDLYKWLLTAAPVASAQANDCNIIKQLQVEIDDFEDEQYVVSWYETVERPNIALYVNNQDTEWLYFDTDTEPTHTTHHFTYDPGANNRILKTEDHYLVVHWVNNVGITASCFKEVIGSAFTRTYTIADGGSNWLVKEFSADGLSGEATIQFQGPPSALRNCSVSPENYSLRVTGYAVYGTVFVLVKLGEIKNPEGSGQYKVIKHDAINVETETEAKQLAQALRKHNEYGRYKYSFVSDTALSVGEYVDVSNTKLNIANTARVVRRRFRSNDRYINSDTWYPLYQYECRGVSELGVLEGTVSQGQFQEPATGSELQEAVIRVNQGLDEAGQVIRVVSGNNIPDDFEPSQTGLYLTRTHIGLWELAEDDWVVRIENDEGVGKFRVGAGDQYVDWDGSTLTVKGDITADVGNIGGWVIDDPELRDSLSRMFLRPQYRRLEIRDSVGATKIALGYLGGVSTFEDTQYGLYIADGNTVEVNGDIDYAAGDWAISDDAAVVIKDSVGNIVGRFGSLGSGDVGLVVGGNAFSDTLTGGGGASSSMEDDLTGGGSAIGIFVELSFDSDVTGGGDESSSMEASLTGGGGSSSIMTDLIGGYGAELPAGSVEGTFGSLIGGGVASGVGVRYSNDDRQLVVRGSFQANTLRLVELPLSDEGLDTGELWNDGGTLKIKV